MPGAAGPCKSLAGLPPLRTGFFSPSPKRQPHRRAGESPWGGGVSGSSQTHLPHSFPLDHPGESCGGWVPYPLPLSHSSEEERMQGGGVLPPPSTVHYSTSLGLPPPPHCFLGLKRMEPAEGRLKSYRMKPGHPGGAATLQSRAVSGEKGVVIGLGEGTHFSESRPGHPTCKGGEEKVGKERKGSPTHCPLPGPETDRSAGTKGRTHNCKESPRSRSWEASRAEAQACKGGPTSYRSAPEEGLPELKERFSPPAVQLSASGQQLGAAHRKLLRTRRPLLVQSLETPASGCTARRNIRFLLLRLLPC
nr:uncharacterized protein LOC127491561 isoform X2 [Oryctolagus cuniculus]